MFSRFSSLAVSFFSLHLFLHFCSFCLIFARDDHGKSVFDYAVEHENHELIERLFWRLFDRLWMPPICLDGRFPEFKYIFERVVRDIFTNKELQLLYNIPAVCRKSREILYNNNIEVLKAFSSKGFGSLSNLSDDIFTLISQKLYTEMVINRLASFKGAVNQFIKYQECARDDRNWPRSFVGSKRMWPFPYYEYKQVVRSEMVRGFENEMHQYQKVIDYLQNHPLMKLKIVKAVAPTQQQQASDGDSPVETEEILVLEIDNDFPFEFT